MRYATPSLLSLLPMLAASVGPATADPHGPLDARDAPYLEGEGTGRVLAMVHAELLGKGSAPRLVVRISAEGPLVDAIPGYRGVRGANALTARELGTLLADGRLAARTVDAAGRHTAGTLTPLRHARVAERRHAADGRLLEATTTTEELLVEVRAESGPLCGPGPADFYVTLSGVPRLRIGLLLDGALSRIVDVESL